MSKSSDELVDNMNRELLIAWLERILFELNAAADEIKPMLAENPKLSFDGDGKYIQKYQSLNYLYHVFGDISRLVVGLRNGRSE